MPELPEVECVVRALSVSVVGKKILDIDFKFTRMLQSIDPGEFARLVKGRIIEAIKRRGKYIFFVLSGGLILEVHLRMTGRFLYSIKPLATGPHTGAVFSFEDGSSLYYEDVRRFGTFRLFDQETLCYSPAHSLGPDPLDEEFSLQQFARLLRHKGRTRIKSLLLNQQNLAGLGNIYTDEALYRAGIHPARPAGDLGPGESKKLFEAIISVLRESILSGGTTFSDYRDLLGNEGNFQDHLQVYRREKEKCRRCGAAIRRTVIAGRGTYYCPACQVLPLLRDAETGLRQ